MKREIVEKIGASFKASSPEQTYIWNLSYGHPNFKGLCLLQINEMVRGLPLIEDPWSSCENCILAKKHREVYMIERPHLDMHLILDQVLQHGHQRKNQ